jgi:hypothetical protein
MGRKNGRGKGKDVTDFSHLIKVEEKNTNEIEESKEKED